MNYLVSIFIFLIVLFLYIHITAQWKTSEDLEIYEMDYTTKAYLQEVCDIKQPVYFNYQTVHSTFFTNINEDTMHDIGDTNDVKIKEIHDYWNESIDSVDYVLLPFHKFYKLLKTDTSSRFFTENNDDYINEIHDIKKEFHSNDVFLKPSFTINQKYDICMGSKDVYTPFRFHTDDRFFLCVNSGSIKVKLSPYKYSNYLYPEYDYENYEFKSRVNIWKPQDKYKTEVKKVKSIDIDIHRGTMLYIPPYWWYSIMYLELNTVVSVFVYNSTMNCLANSGHLARYYLQQSNIKEKVMKEKVIKTVEEEVVEEKEPVKKEEKIEIQTIDSVVTETNNDSLQ